MLLSGRVLLCDSVTVCQCYRVLLNGRVLLRKIYCASWCYPVLLSNRVLLCELSITVHHGVTEWQGVIM